VKTRAKTLLNYEPTVWPRDQALNFSAGKTSAQSERPIIYKLPAPLLQAGSSLYKTNP